MIMTRITSNMIRRNYINNLTNNLGGLESARKQVETGRRFSQSYEDPNAAAKAAILERRYARVEDQIDNVKFAQKWQDTQEDVVSNLSTVATIVAKDYSVRGENGTNVAIESRSAFAQALRSQQEQMVTILNSKYGDSFVLAGNEGKKPPFALDENGKLTYRDKLVSTLNAETEPGKSLLNEHAYVDMGFGLDVERTQRKTTDGKLIFRDTSKDDRPEVYGTDLVNGKPTKYVDKNNTEITDPDTIKALAGVYDTEIAPASAFDTILPGIKLIGYGTTTVKQGANEATTSRNLVDLCGEMARVMELPEGEFTYDEYAMYWEEFADGANKLRDQFAALGTKTQLLEATKSRLENEKLAIESQYEDEVGIVPALAITNYSWANYAYNSALKVGASIITPSLLDFMN